MRIGELSQATGVDVETIRYYEKIDLLPKPERQPNGYRAYGQSQLERLAFIRHCRALDMPIGEVKQLLEFTAKPSADCGDVDRVIEEQLLRVRARLESLLALERQLTSLRAQCKTRHTIKDCGILHDLVATAQGETCKTACVTDR